MNRSSLLAPPVGWLCYACGYSAQKRPERCPKCGGSAFERTGAAAAVEEAIREVERLGEPVESVRKARPGGPRKRRSAMVEFKCVDGCGRKVSREGGRCRTCAGFLRRQKKAASPAPTRDAARPETAKKDHPHSPLPLNFGALADMATALRAAGFNVADIRVHEMSFLVRLTT